MNHADASEKKMLTYFAAMMVEYLNAFKESFYCYK